MPRTALASIRKGTPLPAVVQLPAGLSLVLPAHDEEDNIAHVVRDALDVLPSFTDDIEIIVVNDGSRDKTREIVEALTHEHPALRLVNHEVNRGYGAAVTSGIKASTRPFVMFMDADRQFRIEDLADLSPFAGTFDIVAGFRKERHDPLHRRLFAEIFNVTVRVLFGVHLRDIDCAFKVFRGEMVRALDLSAPGALINTEMQAKLRRMGATLQQVGVNHYPRVAGQATGGNPRVILRAMRETLVLWWAMRTYRPPQVDPATDPAPV